VTGSYSMQFLPRRPRIWVGTPIPYLTAGEYTKLSFAPSRRIEQLRDDRAGIIFSAVVEDRLSRQVAFLIEADKLKTVLRRTPLTDSSRRENSAEHSWHLVLTALILREYAAFEFDVLHTLELLAVHDLVEIDAGDTFAYDAVAQATRRDREFAAADRVFGLLPTDQALYFSRLWNEFERQTTPESQFANALDRFQPLLQNACDDGGTWRAHNLQRDDVLRRMAPVEAALPDLWPLVIKVVDSFCATGVLRTVIDARDGSR